MKKITLLLCIVLLAGVLSACGGSSETASVQSVAMICGIDSTAAADRFAGVIESKSETKIYKDEGKNVAELLVSEGDTVDADQVLFTYDEAQLKLAVEKAEIEIEQQKSSIESKKKEIETLEKQLKSASGDSKLSITLQIQELEADASEAGFTLTSQEKDLEQLKKTLGDLEVKSPVSGKIQSINKSGTSDGSAFITIRETGDFRVKGYVNETNISALFEGMQVLVRSRVDDAVQKGSITTIDLKNPQSGSPDYEWGMSDDTASSSKYPFYVELESTDGFIIGQHVYIEPDYGQADVDPDVIALPSFYINDAEEGDPWVWAQGSGEKLEKRSLTLGEYDEMLDTYVVVSGLTAEDHIAYPDESLRSGMKCVVYNGFTDDGFYNEYNSDLDFVEDGSSEEFDNFGIFEGAEVGDGYGEIDFDDPEVTR